MSNDHPHTTANLHEVNYSPECGVWHIQCPKFGDWVPDDVAFDMEDRLREAFKIIEVLHMDALDSNQKSGAKTAEWLEHNKIFNPSNQPKEDHEKN